MVNAIAGYEQKPIGDGERPPFYFLNLFWLMLSQTWFKNRRFKWRKEIKKAEGGRPERVMAASSVLLLPSPPAMTYQRPNLAPADHQNGSMYAGYCAVNPPMRFSSNTRW